MRLYHHTALTAPCEISGLLKIKPKYRGKHAPRQDPGQSRRKGAQWPALALHPEHTREYTGHFLSEKTWVWLPGSEISHWIAVTRLVLWFTYFVPPPLHGFDFLFPFQLLNFAYFFPLTSNQCARGQLVVRGF